MRLGKDFWIVMRLIIAIFKTLEKFFNNENEDDNEHNGD